MLKTTRSAILVLSLAAIGCGQGTTSGAVSTQAPAPVSIAGPIAEHGVPSRLADSTYWRMVTDMSEPDGFFRSDNLVGNEVSLQWVIPELTRPA